MSVSTHRTRNYRRNTWTPEDARNTFLRQMADYARGEKLKQLRLKEGKSQEEMAHALSVTTKTWGSWEKGGVIRTSNAKRLARYFKVPAGELVRHEIATDVLLDGDPTKLKEQLDRIEEKLDRILQEQARQRGDRPPPHRPTPAQKKQRSKR